MTKLFVRAFLVAAILAFIGVIAAGAYWVALKLGAAEWLAFLIGLAVFAFGVLLKKLRVGIDYD